MAFIIALVPDWSTADDIAQETRVRLWEQFAEYDPERDFGAWARTIAYYQVLTWRRKQQGASLLFNEQLLESIAERANKQTVTTEARAKALRDCLKKLRAPNRQLIQAYYAGSETMKSLAERLGYTFDSFRNRIQRTRLALADCVRNRLREEDR